MSFEFEVYNADGDVAKSAGDGPKVDYSALNQYIVDTCGLQDGDVLVGHVAVLYDLGVQQPADNEFVFDGDSAEEAKIIAANPDVYFKDGFDDKKNPARLKCSPAKPFQHITFAIDFPEIMLNKGKFFGDEDATEKPLRLYLGGEYWMGKDIGFVVQNPLSMKNTTSTGAWSFNSKSTIYKMAVGAKLIKAGEPFENRRVGELIGKSLQFQVQVGFTEHNGKQYLNQNIKLVGGLGRGQSEVQPATTLAYVGFNKDNDEEIVSEIPRHILNTIKRASNYDGSKLKGQIDGLAKEVAKEVEDPKPPVDLDNLPF